MSDLINRLRSHDDPRLYFDADIIMSEAADALEAQAKEIAGLQQINLIIQASYDSTITEYMKLNKELALLNRDLAGKMLEWKSLCHKMVAALELVTRFSTDGVAVVTAQEALKVWMESK